MKNEEVLNNLSNNNENENKKKNYFNLIIGVSTLIIALLGATFAYFTVTGGSAENDVAVQAAMVKIGFEGGTKVQARDLIPTNESVMLWAYQDETKQNTTFTEEDDLGNVTEHTYQCLDTNNKKVCYVYRFTIKSDGEDGTTTRILGKIKVNTNNFVETETCGALSGTRSGLSYMVYSVKDLSDDPNVVRMQYTKVSGGNVLSQNSEDADLYQSSTDPYKFTRFNLPEIAPVTSGTEGDESTIPSAAVAENYLFGDDGYIDIDNNVENEFELVIWLHDDGCIQNQEQGQLFEGTIDLSVDSADNTGTNGRITGKH